MADEFDEWLASLPGSVSAEGIPFLRGVFDQHGPVSRDEVDRIGYEMQVGLAEIAVKLFGRDVVATTEKEPPPFEHRIDAGVRVAYWGQYASNPVFGLNQADVTVEVADFMQAEVVEDLWSGWPICPRHNGTVLPRVEDAVAIWFCRPGNHTLATIGQLA
jgi:hypothetical protein